MPKFLQLPTPSLCQCTIVSRNRTLSIERSKISSFLWVRLYINKHYAFLYQLLRRPGEWEIQAAQPYSLLFPCNASSAITGHDDFKKIDDSMESWRYQNSPVDNSCLSKKLCISTTTRITNVCIRKGHISCECKLLWVVWTHSHRNLVLPWAHTTHNCTSWEQTIAFAHPSHCGCMVDQCMSAWSYTITRCLI